MEKGRGKKSHWDEVSHIRSDGSGWIVLGLVVLMVIVFIIMALKG